MPLTDLDCKKAKPKHKFYKLSDSHGLYLQVMPNGSKYWRMKYRIYGKEKLLALGTYPLISLKEARQGRDNAQRLLEQGIDPSEAKKEEKRQAALTAEYTFEVIAREWHERNKEKWSESYGSYIIKRLELDIFPAIGKRPIGAITTPELLKALQKVENRGVQELPHRLSQLCSQVFRYSAAKGLSENNPALNVKPALKPMRHSHFAALEAKDLPEFIKNLERNEARLYPQTLNAMRLMMLTFVRTSELIKARWDEIDLDNKEWVIPAERMKMRKPHIVPLSKQAISLLEAQRQLTGNGEYVFPNIAHPKKTMSNNTILVALKRMGYAGQMTGHGFRALAMSTIKEKLGYRHEVVDRQLAHAPQGKINQAYDRAAFLPERKKMMQEWSDYIDSVAMSGKIIELDKKKA